METGERPASPPNIIYILSDQHAARVLGCYGDRLGVTPNLDALARRGIVLDQAYCPSPICVPSRMAMLTGRAPHRIGVWTNRDTLGSGQATFVHALGAAGYDTTLIGRLHSLGPDQLRGFSRRYVGDHQSNYWGNDGPGRGVLEGTAGPDYVSLERSGRGLSPYELHDEDVTAAAVGYLRHLGARRRRGLTAPPFLLALGYMLPHAPFVAAPEDFDRFVDSVTLPEIREPYSAGLHPYIGWWRRHTGIVTVDPDVILRARAAYWGLVARLDELIGRVLVELEAAGLLDGTLVVYTTDHGDQLGQHDLWWKHTFYEDSVRVPAVVAWPGRLPAGERRRQVVSTLDLTASLVAAAGAPELPACDGRDLVPLLETNATPWDDVVFSEYCSDEFAPPGGLRQRMVRRGAWKLVYYDGQPGQLFNLEEDPDERHDRFADASLSAVREELLELVLAGWSPGRIEQQMVEQRQAAELIGAWARATRPVEQYQWPLTEEMNRLDESS